MEPRCPGLSAVSHTLQYSKTKTLEDVLLDLGMEKYRNSKMTLRDVLSIGLETSDTFRPKAKADLPGHFLMNIIALDRSARKMEVDEDLSNQGSSVDDDDDPLELFGNKRIENQSSKSLHPSDVMCAVLNCSDKCLQQEVISKMSMCQFAVPLLLPAGDGSGSTFMLWAMREIVKKWRPQSLTDSKGFMEDNVVNIEMPIFSFVRLGPNKLSKSKVLNQVLNPPQQHHDFFIHDNMEGGNIERKISDGLVEMSWYFPAGKSDVFPEPIAVANLRGDLEDNREQFTFLTRISSATFIFIESLCERQFRLLSSCSPSDTKFYFIVTSGKDKTMDPETRKNMQILIPILKIEKSNVISKSGLMNDAGFITKIQKIIDHELKNDPKVVKLKDINKEVSNLNINTDETSPEFWTTKHLALSITSMIHDVESFKNQSLTLQGDLWKQLSKLEKEMCRMRNQGGENQQAYLSELKLKQRSLLRQQHEHNVPGAMRLFINAITDLHKNEKQYFLKWMKFELDSIARKNLSKLQSEYKENCKKPDASANPQKLKQLDKRISESSLGIEHFLRELGQFYEAEHSTVKNESDKKLRHFPGVAADLLLDGFPLELIDGDASNIPLQWITDVLTELDKKTGERCRMRVITVLGVQSTGKSTLLNTMFGLQFPVATRGAFMTLIKVKENFQEELGCEFVLVIDTEVLKAPELASLDDSYEHDNELATLVVGLSDITIVNMAMENTTAMKDILQIVVHAFLRMKEIGKRSNCQFVHQNVSDVTTDEMTKVAAKMENKCGFEKFCDVMEYDLEKHNWYIPGLWQGVPPMAPVNSGYSEHVSEMKEYLLKFLKNKRQDRALTIPAFCEWVESLWTAVKHEKFIFSFRNSLVAEAYNKLSMQFSLWEWNFTNEIYKWVVRQENIIKYQTSHNLDANRNKIIKDLDQLLIEEEKKMMDLIEKYFESESENVNLIKKYHEEFRRSVTTLRREQRRNAIYKCEKTLSIQKGKLKIEDIKKQYQAKIEGKIDELLRTCREKNKELSDLEVEAAFDAMWKKTLDHLQIEKLESRNVSDAMLQQLRQDMSSRGPDINKKLLAVKRLGEDKGGFKIDTNSHIDKVWCDSLLKAVRIKNNEPYEKLGDFATSLIEMCDAYVTEKENTTEDYDDTYCQEILQKINRSLEDDQYTSLHFTVHFVLDIKLFIFGKASRRFQKMHDKFIETKDPRTCMENMKKDYLNVFLECFNIKGETGSRGRQFCEKCLIPAITNYIYDHLGRTMVDDILNGSDNQTFKSRSFFQYNLLKNLLEEMSFQKYVQYINNYEKFSKDIIMNKISAMYQKPEALEALQADLISSILRDVRGALTDETILQSEDIPHFLQNVHKKLKEKLVISESSMQIIAFNNKVKVGQFSSDIQTFLDSTENGVWSELKSVSFESLLSKIKLKPQDELLRKVIGCRKQCPFCKVPCEAGGGDHREHFASVHRPQGLGRYKWSKTKILVTDICNTDVKSEAEFRNLDTHGKYHPYKEYRTYYPDWSIQPDPSIKSSDYWKYIFAKFNGNFAEEYKAKPAELPDDWKEITEEEALSGLKKLFNVV
ncbi:hypothetical protein GDO81_022085 [Engystomops pustulosus]|uniref:VLIG-type G domain-containing protein n=1 Tax=Engystomops pustulosus TaxID=76066 RepID=A0AAV6ZJ60_ENGPU|nr:hypothetical protein GDO81_022085 [Engystomops pustulosus]